MIKIAAIGVAAAILAAWIKGVKADYAVWIILAAGIFLGGSAFLKLEMILSELRFLQEYISGYGTYFKILIKIIGIAYVAEFSSDFCKDAGANTLASQVEVFGKLSILVLCMPIVTALLETIDHFLGG